MTYWVRYYGGSAVAWGEGKPVNAPGQAVRTFETRALRDAAIEGVAREESIRTGLAQVDALKTGQEYAGKTENAVRWLSVNADAVDDVGDYTADNYPWLAVECDHVAGCTPRAAAEAIMAVLNRDAGDEPDGPLKQARRRVALREMLRGL